MDSFESLIRLLLETDHYWTFQSHKIELSKDTRRSLGKPSMPRTEIDLLAFKPASNQVLVLEVKSFLDSPGVKHADLEEEFDTPTGRYKLFTCTQYREEVLKKLRSDLIERGLCNENSTFQLGLAAGRVYRNQSAEILRLFSLRNWFFLSPEDIRERTSMLSTMGYENNPYVITSKVLSEH